MSNERELPKSYMIDFKQIFPDLSPFGENHKLGVFLVSDIQPLLSENEELKKELDSLTKNNWTKLEVELSKAKGKLLALGIKWDGEETGEDRIIKLQSELAKYELAGKELPPKKPEQIMVYHNEGINHPMADIYAEGFNTCHDLATSLLKKKDDEIAESRETSRILQSEASNRNFEIIKLLNQITKLREALELILPLAKGYVADNQVGSNQKFIEIAQQALSGKE